jgi:tetraacyldisaccharide 4'-kinase
MLRAKLLGLGHRLIERGAWYFAPFSWVYAFVVFCRNTLYDWRWLPIAQVDATVVSVGNIVAGGTGKTPFVHLLAKTFAHRKVAILSRGYGEMPDEAMLLARRLPHVKVYVGKDRLALAKAADADLLILDDGFQHRRLHRDVDIVLVRNQKEHYLPWGFLRDSPKRLKEAEVISVADLKLTVQRILDLGRREVPSIQGWKVAVFCGIANPESFKKTVRDLGAEIIAEKIFVDHECADLSKLPKASALICTEKDFVKLPPTDLPIYFLEMEMEVVGGLERWEKLVEKIDQKIDNRRTYGR